MLHFIPAAKPTKEEEQKLTSHVMDQLLTQDSGHDGVGYSDGDSVATSRYQQMLMVMSLGNFVIIK